MKTTPVRRLTIYFFLIVIAVGNAKNEDTSDDHSRAKRATGPNVMDLGVSFDGLPNMLSNPSFETEFPAKRLNPWVMSNSFNQVRTNTEAKDGSYSLKVSGRTNQLHGAAQMVTGLKPGRAYAVSGFIKLLNENDALWQQAKAQLQFTFTDSPDKPEYVLMALTDTEVVPPADQTTCVRSGEAAKTQAALKPDRSATIAYDLVYRGFITKADGWVALEGNINAPMREFESEVEFGVNGPDVGIEFLLDDLKLVELPEHPDWLSKALQETDRNRKKDFDISFQLPGGVSAKDFDVEVKLKKHQFAFGAKIEDDCVTAGQNAQRYKDFVYNVFNWAVVGSYKWRFDKGTRTAPDFSNAIDATTALLANGLKVRAHCILWDVQENIPDWVQNLTAAQTPAAVDAHVRYMVNITKGRVEQWDVQNEATHEHYYENKLRNRTFTMDIFKLVRQLDPIVRLYLNDYQAVTTGAQTLELTEQVRRFRAYGAEINGIGIQGHTKDYVKPDPLMIWHRLNQFGQLPDLDVMVTEFDLGHNDDVVRADWYEDAMRGFFAHPVLKGHIMWGFWDQRMRYDNMYLIYGSKFKWSEVATRYACLVKKEWTTTRTANLGSDQKVSVRGYLGDYDVIVKRKGVVVQRTPLPVGARNEYNVAVTDKLQLDPGTTPPAEDDYIGECISHRGQTTLVEVTSPSSSSRVSCVSRVREMVVSASSEASVACETGEILTGCFGSVLGRAEDVPILTKVRLGERIVLSDSVPTCKAFVDLQGYPSARDIKLKVTARCCTIPDLACSYRQAGPSLLMEDAMAEATCPQGKVALGCAAYSAKSQVGGVVYRGNNPASCVAKNGASLHPVSPVPNVSGVMASAACCSRGAGSMTCTVVTANQGQGQRNVSCPDSSYVMTSCSAQGPAYDTKICMWKTTETCLVFGQASAVATCCKVSDMTPSTDRDSDVCPTPDPVQIVTDSPNKTVKPDTSPTSSVSTLTVNIFHTLFGGTLALISLHLVFI